MAIRLPSHLHRARSGVLHFRIAIPPDLRQHFNIREIYRSLRTSSVREAAPAAQTLSQAAKRLFIQLRNTTMAENATLLDQVADLKRDVAELVADNDPNAGNPHDGGTRSRR